MLLVGLNLPFCVSRVLHDHGARAGLTPFLLFVCEVVIVDLLHYLQSHSQPFFFKKNLNYHNSCMTENELRGLFCYPRSRVLG